ncbi:uncharacterized protein LOC143470324 [Clavelina lepadiformis]|uniref:uncharacterized protein LOC143470324 n=1 Tax=Clavelina lepadiformis TaxID=159417 RepID=UPI0040413886
MRGLRMCRSVASRTNRLKRVGRPDFVFSSDCVRITLIMKKTSSERKMLFVETTSPRNLTYEEGGATICSFLLNKIEETWIYSGTSSHWSIQVFKKSEKAKPEEAFEAEKIFKFLCNILLKTTRHARVSKELIAHCNILATSICAL